MIVFKAAKFYCIVHCGKNEYLCSLLFSDGPPGDELIDCFLSLPVRLAGANGATLHAAAASVLVIERGAKLVYTEELVTNKLAAATRTQHSPKYRCKKWTRV